MNEIGFKMRLCSRGLRFKLDPIERKARSGKGRAERETERETEREIEREKESFALIVRRADLE